MKKEDFTPSELKKFFSCIQGDSKSGCWNWNGNTCRDYGRMRIGGKPRYASHISALLFGKVKQLPLRKGFDCDHLCKNSRCVNPQHLEVIPHAENMKRAAEAGAWEGARNSNARTSLDKALAAKILMKENYPGTKVARALGVPERTIYHIGRDGGWRFTDMKVIDEERRREGRPPAQLKSLRYWRRKVQTLTSRRRKRA